MRLAVKGWTTFQHYKQRRPPWIRLHRSLLDDYTFAGLPDASRALAPCLWLLASESTDGTVTGDRAELAFRLRQSPQWIEKALKPLIEGGFLVCLQDASDALAVCKQNVTTETEESRDRVETEERGHASTSPHPSPEEVQAYIEEQGHSGFTGQQFVDHYTANGWKVGRNPMKDWKAAVRTWAARDQHRRSSRTAGINPHQGAEKSHRGPRCDCGLPKPEAFVSCRDCAERGQWLEAYEQHVAELAASVEGRVCMYCGHLLTMHNSEGRCQQSGCGCGRCKAWRPEKGE